MNILVNHSKVETHIYIVQTKYRVSIPINMRISVSFLKRLSNGSVTQLNSRKSNMVTNKNNIHCCSYSRLLITMLTYFKHRSVKSVTCQAFQ